MQFFQKLLIVNLLIISGLSVFSCSGANSEPSVAAVSPEPDPTATMSKQQKIDYHVNEIRKYKANVEREEQNALRFLSQRNMSDVRASNRRKQDALNKIHEHTSELKQLRDGAGS